MGKKTVDGKLRILIENGIALNHRSMFVIVGDKAKDQVVILHHILKQAALRASPTVLWCYKKQQCFEKKGTDTYRKLYHRVKGNRMDVNEKDPFQLFIKSTQIRFCYYSETHRILGNTYGMCILQDFEAMTPNLLARTIETVEGGGLIIILLKSVQSLKQLYTMTMDVHDRYRTEAHQGVVGRFNERFILSLSSCKQGIVMDDQMNIIPLSSHISKITAVPSTKKDELSPEQQELEDKKEQMKDTKPVGLLVNCCKTMDQAKALMKFIDVISENSLRTTVSLTAARGRGKSAALGLAISAAVAFGYSNIFVTSPSPENLKTLFDFIFKGFDAIEYKEHKDYEIIQSTNPDFNKAVVRVNVFSNHRQSIQYIHPSDANKLGAAELVVIDEAAAIPLPLVRALLGPYLVFMASTINGYEGTGRSLSLKLIQQLRQQTSSLSAPDSKIAATTVAVTGRVLHELVLNESIRYGAGDEVEKWLNNLLCLDCSVVPHIGSGCPAPEDCDLFYINRDTLFSYHKTAESFLQKLIALYVASHYKNSPNDLQMMSDAPAHQLFCLLGPTIPNQTFLPDILCVVQVCLEGDLSATSIDDGLRQGKRPSGDLIPWTVTQQFQDDNFGRLCGGRIVRIATHPDYQRMGYGRRAIELLQRYYQGQIQNVDENQPEKSEKKEHIKSLEDKEVELLTERVTPREDLPSLLLKLSERPPEKLDWLGVSYGVTSDLLRFWKKCGFTPVYMRQTTNDLTGEHSCVMLKSLDTGRGSTWLAAFWSDFRQRFLSLLGYQFRIFTPSLALGVAQNKAANAESKELSVDELEIHLTKYDLLRLIKYSENQLDYHVIVDLMPVIAKLYFQGRLSEMQLSSVQSAILLGLGLQHKTMEDLSKELDLPVQQLMGLFSRTLRKITQHLKQIKENAVAKTVEVPKQKVLTESLMDSLQKDLDDAEKMVNPKRKRKPREYLNEEDETEKKLQKLLQDPDLSKYMVQGTEDDWGKALAGGKKDNVTMKSFFNVKPLAQNSDKYKNSRESYGKKMKHKKKK